MKAVVIGDTFGIGKAVKDYFVNQNFEVIGISRTRGYDIERNFDEIVSICKDADIVFNNLCYKEYQKEILEKIYKHVSFIIVSGGVIRNYTNIKPELSFIKSELYEFCNLLSSIPTQYNVAKILYLDFSFIKSTIGDDRYNSDEEIPLESIVSIIDIWLSNPYFWNVEFNLKLTSFVIESLGGKDKDLDKKCEKVNYLISIADND